MPKLKKKSHDMRRMQNIQLLADSRANELYEQKIRRQSLDMRVTDRKRKAEDCNNETLNQKITRQALDKERTAKARDNETLTQKITSKP